MEVSLEQDPVESRPRCFRHLNKRKICEKKDIKAVFSLFFTKGAFHEDIKANISGFLLDAVFSHQTKLLGAGSGGGGGVDGGGRLSPFILQHAAVSDSAD